MKALIKKLVEIDGPSGYETKVREAVEDELKGHVNEWSVDGLGNLITRKGKKAQGGKTIMLAAHLDELGVMVTHVDENGFARFTNLGAVFPRNTAGARVRFLNGARGVIGFEPHTSYSSVPPMTKMYIDLGAASKKECPVEIGDVAAFERGFEDLGNRIVSKAFDDRLGVAVLIETMKQIEDSPNEIVGVFTVQEEVGLRGATTSAFGVAPEVGIAIDVGKSPDTPGIKDEDIRMGNGPSISIKDQKMIADPRIVAWIEAGAKRAKIPTQRAISGRGWTDALAIQTSRAGVPVSGLSIPTRYVHSPSEMADINDIENTVRLLVHLLTRTVKL